MGQRQVGKNGYETLPFSLNVNIREACEKIREKHESSEEAIEELKQLFTQFLAEYSEEDWH